MKLLVEDYPQKILDLEKPFFALEKMNGMIVSKTDQLFIIPFK